MKVTGPSNAGVPVAPAAVAEGSSAEAAGPSFRDLLAPGDVSAPGAAAPPSSVAEVVAQLRAGTITGPQAADLLLEAVIRAKVPEAAPELQARLRTELTRLLAEDPILAAKMRRLSEGEK
jgi:hypothetical protein